MSIDILKGQIKNKEFGNLYLFYGPEEYLKRYYLDLVEKDIVKGDFKDINKVLMDGKIETKRLIDNCDTLPLFSEKKLVVVKNSGLFKSAKKSDSGAGKGKASKGKASTDDFLTFLQNVPQHVCLVFVEEEIDKRLKPVDAVKKHGLMVEFSYQKPAELVRWVIKVFKSYNKIIEPDVASVLVNNSEQGMNEILNEINKLVLYLGDREKASMKDIEKVCSKSIKSRIFDLTDAIAEKNRTKAYKILEDMVVLKEPMPRILFMITRQLRQVLEMRLFLNEGMGLNEAAAKMGLTPYIAGKIARQAREFHADDLKKTFEESLELDVAVKTGRISDRMAVEMLIVRFSEKTGSKL
jgi:DNA polymerase-3 subunit delta